MNDEQFSDELSAKLTAIEQLLQQETLAPPATQEKNLQQERRRPILDQAAKRAAALRDQLVAARAPGQPMSDATCKQLEDKWAEIERLLAISPADS